MNSKRVGILMGGSSAEREISLKSGRAVARALEQAGHDIVRIELGTNADPAEQLRRAAIDVAFLALHGRFGEDGCVQGMLELLGIPYTGSGVLESALAMDKLKSKELFRLHNVPTPPYYVYSGAISTDDILETHGSFGYPAMVKPRREGSSIGISRATDDASLIAAVRIAAEHDRDVLVERFVRGQEITVGILNGRVLGALEIAPSGGLFDFNAKYTSGATEYHMPARLTPALYKNVLFLAERAADALGVSGAARVDLIVTEGQNEYVLEVNSLPGMTPTSLLPKIAESAGFGFVELCDAILSSARLHVQGARPKRASVVPLVTNEERSLRVIAG
ncbi:MAG TPA: D-alanine--D-alanine ligase [Polyangiaceae bacterium]